MPNRVFLDTNCFLHLRDLRDLPWRDLFPGQVIDILVASVVIDELDRLKTEKSGRIRDRARAALNLIEAASVEPGMRLNLRDKPQLIWLVIDQGAPIDWSAFPRLDGTRPDDQLVAAALSSGDDGSTRLLSYDSGPLIRARIAGLSAHKSPASWALPPQKDKAEQEVARLQRELDAVKSTHPVLLGRFIDVDNEGVLRLPIPELPDLPFAVTNRLMEEVRRQLPRESIEVSNGAYSIAIGGISRAEADRYYAKYDEFLERWRRLFAELPALISHALRFGEVRYELRNDSKVTAINLRTSIIAPKNFTQYGRRSDMEAVGGSLPRIEKPKAPRAFPGYDSLINPALLHREQRRDPTGFYWLDRPKGDGAVLTCEEFRPEQVRLASTYIIGPPGEAGDTILEVSATNLPQPFRISVPTVFEPLVATWNHPAVVCRLPEWMTTIIAQTAN